ncbi:MAG: dihydrodipicolinate reductase C-terminal domain-containing protein [Candidatus Moranbacteria bacterium]|nr:dihydrodipicolinate reductase C-terminal domain-containing protein [Candidatus Moranbacteria bacterium]
MNIEAFSKGIRQNISTILSDKEDNAMKVMVNGLPGKMAKAVVEIIVHRGGPVFQLAHIALTGPNVPDNYYPYSPRGGVDLMHPGEVEKFLPEINEYLKKRDFFAVDYTQPAASTRNAELYCQLGIPFVMGTTGGDRERIVELVKQSGISAVVAPNMAAQVVAFQAMMEYAAKTFPGAFEGFALSITESHQQGKADTSGTAKAVMASLEKLGVTTGDRLRMVRDPEEQLAMGIPPQFIGGHGWHEYRLASRDGTVALKFVHNVSGRLPYAAGTLKALFFLEKKIAEGSRGEVFSMIDVLKG